MITKEEYLKAKAIVDEYEQEEYEQGMRDAEEDDDFDEDDLEEQREMERAETAMNCSCGAWVIGKDGRGYHVADCICGAE